MGDEAARGDNLAVIENTVMPEPGTLHEDFVKHKVSVLERTLRNDRSPKGCVDTRVVGLLDEINKRPEFVTLSSCSGRCLFMAYSAGGEAGSTEGDERDLVLPNKENVVGSWRRVSHDCIEDAEEYFSLESEPLNDGVDTLMFRFQPFSLDISCASPEDAKRLVNAANLVYHRGASVIAPRREWRSVVSIEAGERIDMPFKLGGQKAYSGSNEFLGRLVNDKFARNWADMDRLLETFQRVL